MNIDLFLQTLPVMGMGMLGIFAVIIVIMLVVVALNKITSLFAKRKKEPKQ